MSPLEVSFCFLVYGNKILKKKKKKFMGINDRPKYLSYTNGGLVFNSKRTPIYGRLSFRKAFPFGTSCGHMEKFSIIFRILF